MSRKLQFMAFLAGFFLCISLTSQASHAQENGGKEFEINADGTLKAGGLEFATLSEYVKSDYFKIMGKRCLIKGLYERGEFRADTSDCNLSQTVIQSEYYPAQSFTIPIAFHVIYKTDGTGNISDQRIYDQVEVLNEDFRAISGTMGEQGFDTMIQFELAGVTRTENDTWFNDQDEYGYKSALGWDQDRYLNIYSNSASGYLGYAYLPQQYAGHVLDGVVLLYAAVGGRDNGFDPYDQGRTAVHEIGHYLGLYHTFEGGCVNGYTVGDLIADTNSEETAHFGCTQTYTCGTADPIHNYMDYTDDDCMYKFTQEQGNRLVCSSVNYRPQLGETTPIQTPTPPSGVTPTPPGGYYTPTPIPQAEIIHNGLSFNPGDFFQATFQLNESIERPFTAFAVVILPNGGMLNALTLDSPLKPVVTNIPRLSATFTYQLIATNIPNGEPSGNYEVVVAFFDPGIPITGIDDAFLTASGPFSIAQ